jgi:Domain of unknown function (DUF4399)
MKRLIRLLLLVTAALSLALPVLSHAPAADAQATPTVRITAPTNGATVNNPVTVTVVTSGAVIKNAGANDPTAAHLHYFIDRDPAGVLQPGQPIPSGQADIIHTPDTSQVLPNLSPGSHSVWVVLAHTDHTPYIPNVQDRVTFTIGGAATPTAAAAAAPATAPATATVITAQLPPGGTGGLLPSAHAGRRPQDGQAADFESELAARMWPAVAALAALSAAGALLLPGRRRARRG